MMYNRIRIIILDSSIKVRDGEAARAKYDDVFVPLGGEYSGYIAHSYFLEPSPAHFYLIPDPSDEVLATLLLLSREYPIRMSREFKGEGSVAFTLDGIVSDIAAVLRSSMLDDGTAPQSANQLARCWSGAKVMEAMLRQTL
jgi:hypothetical protein